MIILIKPGVLIYYFNHVRFIAVICGYLAGAMKEMCQFVLS
jgi:hypothetical protein